MTTALFTLAYPKVTSLKDGTKVTLRPMEPADQEMLLEFFQRLPEDDRFYLKDDVTSPQVISQWAEHINYYRAFPLLAIVDGRVVADASLHHKRPDARSHLGEIRISVDPDYRNRGLGTRMVTELIEVAYNRGLELVIMELVEEKEAEAIAMAQRLGFAEKGHLQGHVKDSRGVPQSLVVLELSLSQWFPDWVWF